MCFHLLLLSSIYFGLFTVTYIHQKALEALWRSSFPGTELLGLVSDQWKEMGWQGKDPSTDFRGGGFISLENLLYFSRNYPVSTNYLTQLLAVIHRKNSVMLDCASDVALIDIH
ncbi:ELMO/CED-12 family protein [Zea mays]|uniref:ELMO/CED-12 family protein n=1 Tax=Zea mays TaxID=4577 RepID=A0A1D6JBK5_MAIZE|nr:ELMO/CED-12 family protein [Zea mays]